MPPRSVSDSQTLTETDAALSTSGTLTSSDVDNTDDSFTADTIVGTIGTFSIDAAGAWTFTANSAFDNLNVGDNVNETFNVTSVGRHRQHGLHSDQRHQRCGDCLQRQPDPDRDRCGAYHQRNTHQ